MSPRRPTLLIAVLASALSCGVLALALRTQLRSLRSIFRNRCALLAREEEEEETQEESPSSEADLAAPPVSQPLFSLDQLLTWTKVPSSAQAPPSPLHPSPDPQAESLLSQAKKQAGMPALSPAQIEASRAKTAARARNTAFCAAPTNSVDITAAAADASALRSSQAMPGANACPSLSATSPQVPGSLPPASSMKASAASRPQLLVCHDMQGGYLDDRFPQGSSNSESFRMWRWQSIDIFVYFSHHLVTIPPPPWIAAAHRHNTKVLGTFITEWDAGSRVMKRLLSSRAMAQQAADQLVSIAQFHGFDGWLINIESTLHPASRYIPALLHFLSYLRARMHAACGPHASVIWYDAVTTEGHLCWQNAVTPLNYPFFDVCDGIFLNYHWKAETPAQVAAVAGSRSADVFFGVDVFGRGTYGGGQFSCNEALFAARMAGVSAALFGPGWVYENFPESSEQEMEERSEEFWRRIEEVWAPRPAFHSQPPMGLPFVSSFCEAKGRSFWVHGSRVSCAPWCNMSALDVQPALLLPGQPGTLAGHSAAAPPSAHPPSPPSVRPASACTAESARQHAWMALEALWVGSTAVRQPASQCCCHPTPGRQQEIATSSSSSSSSSSSVLPCRDTAAWNGATCLVVRPPSTHPCAASPHTPPPLIHPLYSAAILVPPTGLRVTHAAAHPQPHTGSPNTTRLAIALWLSPTRASPTLTECKIVAVLPPHGATQLERACRAAGLECVHGCAYGTHDRTSSSGSGSGSDSFTQADHSERGGRCSSSGGCSSSGKCETCEPHSPWELFQLGVGPGVLPPGALIVGVGVVCCAAVDGEQGVGQAQELKSGGGHRSQPEQQQQQQQEVDHAALLGHIALYPDTAAPKKPLPTLNVHSSNLVTRPTDHASLLVSCDLFWERCMTVTSSHPVALTPLYTSYHVWVRSGGVQSGDAQGGEWEWLGAATTERFHCHRQLMMEGCRGGHGELEFAVQPVRACDGLVAAELSECSRAVLPVEL